MSRFSIRNPYLILVLCLALLVVGISSLVRMPVDLFPADQYSGGGGCDVLFGYAAGADRDRYHGPVRTVFHACEQHRAYRIPSLPGVSLIKVYFQPGTDADAAVTNISNLAMANLRSLPPGTLPPVVLRFDASSLPVCLITLKGTGTDRDSVARRWRNTRCAIR